MNDGQRVYPVNYWFLHHSAGQDFANADDLTVQDWFSDIGKDRGYGGGSINSNHEHPSRPGRQTYAQAQFALREYTKDGNKYGYRLTDLMQRPWQNVAWAVGDWWYNQRSCSVEICGNFTNKTLPDKALMLLADFLRPVDEELGGALQVWLHQEVFATACPARIKEQRDRLVDMINRPAYWNGVLWPVVPQPVVSTKTETITEPILFAERLESDPTLPVGTRKIQTTGINGLMTKTYKVTYIDGRETARELQSSTVTIAPVTQVVLIGTYVEPTTDYGEENNTLLKQILAIVQEIIAKLTGVFK